MVHAWKEDVTLPPYNQIELPLLQEVLAAGGEVRPRDLYPCMRKYFPSITDADMALTLQGGGNLWTNRIQWARQSLVAQDELYREPRGIWRITPKGAARVKGELTPSKPEAPAPTVPQAAESFPPPLTVLPAAVDALCDRLLKSQKQSSAPKNFERVLGEAFRFLGFNVREQGRAGETDLVLDTHIGPDTYRTVVDAKATHANKVSDGQINWLAIHQHQEQSQADHAVIVGVDFSGGNLLKWANQYQIALVRTSNLIDVIRMHDEAPFSLIDLRPLLSTSGPAQQSVQDLNVLHGSTMRHWQLLLDVVELIDNYNRFNKAGLVATPQQIQLMLYTKITSQSKGDIDPSSLPSVEDVRAAMVFLSSRATGILREAPGVIEHYHLVMHFPTAVERLAALAHHVKDLEDPPPHIRLGAGE